MGNLFPISRVPFANVVNASTSFCVESKEYRDDVQTALLATAGAAMLLVNLLKVFSVKKFTWRALEMFPIPAVDLHHHSYRLIHCLILTLWATDAIQDSLNRDMHYQYRDNGLLDAVAVFILSPTVVFLRQALFYFPILACVHSSVPILTYCVGFSFTTLMVGYNVYREALVLQGCSYRGQLSQTNYSKPTSNMVAEEKTAISLAVKVPVYLGYLWVISWYFCSALRALVQFFARVKTKEPDLLSGFRDRVSYLLRSSCKSKKTVPLKHQSLLSYIIHGFRYVLPLESGFYYPLSFLSSICMAWAVLYQLCIQAVTREVELANDFIKWVESFNITVELLKTLMPSLTHHLDNIFYDANSLTLTLLIIVPFGTCIGLGLCAFFTMYLVQNVHKHLVRASRGDLTFLVASEPLPSKAYVLAANMKFTAFQVAYIVVCWILYSFMMSSLLFLGFIFYYLFKNSSFQAIHLWSYFMIPMMWSSALHYVQIFLCRYIFLAPDSSGGDVIAVRFKGLYYFLSYFLLFFNVIFAVVMGFLRVVGALIFTVVMYMRLDWDVYMRGLEGWDFGHRTYVGYIYMEYTQNNAVLRVFIELLQNSAIRHRVRYKTPPLKHVNGSINRSSIENEKSSLLTKRHTTKKIHYSNGLGPEGFETISSKDSSCRARNRWLVAYTLIRNPQLCRLTGTQLRMHVNYGIQHVLS